MIQLADEPELLKARGEVIRSALSLSLSTAKAFTWRSPGAGLTAFEVALVLAAQTVGEAKVTGAEVGSVELSFHPTTIRPGNYLFDVGATGSVPILFQMLAIPLSLAAAESSLKLRGGTHLEGTPSFHDLSLAWIPMLEPLGFKVRAELEHAGFGAEGGGEVTGRVFPFAQQPPFSCVARGTLGEVTIHSLLAQGSLEVAQRQSERARKRLREAGIAAEAQNLPLSGRSRGTACVITASFEGSRVCFSAAGTSSTPVEEVADRAVSRFLEFMSGRGAVDERTAESLVIPLSLIAGGVAGKAQSGRFTTSGISPNLRCQLLLAQRFLSIRAVVRGEIGGEGEVIVAPPPALQQA